MMADQGTPQPKLITELKTSAHLMLLDTGVFCIFHTPGGQAPDPRTGLPGVRLSLPPAPAQLGRIRISTFLDDGWIGGAEGAALVRVEGGPAQVLVTVYQSPDGAQEAPRLQVMRLTEDAQAERSGVQAAPQPAAAPAGQVQMPGGPAEVVAHVHGRGDLGGKLGEWMGERGSKRWIEGFAIAVPAELAAGDIEYQAVLGRDWLSPWAEGGQFCGSRGMSLPVLGLRARLRGRAAETHDLALAATFVDGSAAGPIGSGEGCQAESFAPLEAFRVELRERETTAARRSRSTAVTKPAVTAPAAKASRASHSKDAKTPKRR